MPTAWYPAAAEGRNARSYFACQWERTPSAAFVLGGSPEGTRTPNLLIRSQMLYQLSYGRPSLTESTTVSSVADAADDRTDAPRGAARPRAPSASRRCSVCVSPVGPARPHVVEPALGTARSLPVGRAY
ncbi:MAG: hypothetical protein JWP75_1082 [Frondihabitans sp.]|nr:hypothetical protein [Frondihabitans sp.]